MTFLEEAKEIQDYLVGVRHHLHQIPEVGLDLPETSAFVEQELIKFGYTPKRIGKSGLLVEVGGKKEGKVVMLRADYDALPIVEETGLEIASTNGNMHACGHDTHATMLLGAAKLLKHRENDIEGMIKLIFQPGEETLDGALEMIENGVLENPKVDAAAMIHSFTGLPFDIGTVILPNPGPFLASIDIFSIKVTGKGCHGAMPQDGVDPINVAAHIYFAFQEIISREISLHEGTVLTIGKFHGGNTHNVIPNEVELQGTLRCFNDKTLEFVKSRMEEVVGLTAKTFRATAELTYLGHCPANVNDEKVLKISETAIREVVGKENIAYFRDFLPGGKISGSEDFAFIAKKIPSVTYALAAGDAREDATYPQHHPKATFDDDILYRGVATHLAVAFSLLKEL